MALKKLYSVTAAAESLGGVSVWTLYSWLSKGRLQGVKIGRRVMIEESELKRLVQSGRKRHRRNVANTSSWN